jgi:hypothetical protein
MDNGFIFPYPRECAHAESGDAKHAKRQVLREELWSLRTRLVVGKPKG